jgi:predicted acyl esterase
MKRQSLYITMRDGVRLAVDVFLPQEVEKGEKVPTILNQTRYYRSWQLRFPLNIVHGNFASRSIFFYRIANTPVYENGC